MNASDPQKGAIAALGAFLCWGLFGLFFKSLSQLPALEVLSHRIAGGALFSALLLLAVGGYGELPRIWAVPRHLWGLAASACAVAYNWGVYIWAVGHDRALEAGLGYFIFPLVSVLLGRVILGERLSVRQQCAVWLAALGVGWLMWQGDDLPWVAVTLAFSFALYGLLRKTIPVQPLTGLLVETLVLLPPALGYLLWMGGGMAVQVDGMTQIILAMAGPVTAIPLILFAYGARRLRLSTMGLMMYINPTVQTAIAAFVFHEAVTNAHRVTFIAVWCALFLYSWPNRRTTP